MPHLPVDEYTKHVGQDGQYQEINKLYDAHYGPYKDPVQPTRIKPGEDKPNKQLPSPFTLK